MKEQSYKIVLINYINEIKKLNPKYIIENINKSPFTPHNLHGHKNNFKQTKIGNYPIDLNIVNKDGYTLNNIPKHRGIIKINEKLTKESLENMLKTLTKEIYDPNKIDEIILINNPENLNDKTIFSKSYQTGEYGIKNSGAEIKDEIFKLIDKYKAPKKNLPAIFQRYIPTVIEK